MNPDWLKSIPASWEVEPQTKTEQTHKFYRDQGRLLERKRIIEALKEAGEVLHIQRIITIVQGDE